MNLDQLKISVEKIIGADGNNKRFYHSLAHTMDVLKATELLIPYFELDPEATVLIRAAALLHETGMTRTMQEHEEASVEIAREILPEYGFNPDQIDRIAQMIRATKMPQNPADTASMIICDADLDYLGREDYFIIAHKLRLEWIINDEFTEDLLAWYQGQITFLENHRYFTATARGLREKGKQHNLSLIRDLCRKLV